MFQALVFDFDGLIIDTETPWFEAYQEIFQEHGLTLTLEEYAKYLGTHGNPIGDLVKKKKCNENELRKQVNESHAKRMEQEQLRPGVVDYLQTAKQLGLKIGLASSSRRDWVEGFLRKYNLIDYFDCIFTANEVAKVKPDPELYLKAIDHLGVSAEQAIAFEDSPNGAKAAKAAGLTCVIVPNSLSIHMNFDEYDLKISSMAECSLQEVIERLSKNGM